MAIFGIPDFKRSIEAGADNPLSIGAEGYAPDTSSVRLESPHLLSAFGIADCEYPDRASAGNPLAIGAECHGPDKTGVPIECLQFLSANRIP